MPKNYDARKSPLRTVVDAVLAIAALAVIVAAIGALAGVGWWFAETVRGLLP